MCEICKRSLLPDAYLATTSCIFIGILVISTMCACIPIGYIANTISPLELLKPWITIPTFVLPFAAIAVTATAIFMWFALNRENTDWMKKGVIIMVILVVICVAFLTFSTVVVIGASPENKDQAIRSAIIKYSTNKQMTEAIDGMQKQFQCCGIVSYKDWDFNKLYKCSYGNFNPLKCSVPVSCCKQNETIAVDPKCGADVRDIRESFKGSPRSSARKDKDAINTGGCSAPINAALKEAGICVLLLYLLLSIIGMATTFLEYKIMMHVIDKRTRYESETAIFYDTERDSRRAIDLLMLQNKNISTSTV